MNVYSGRISGSGTIGWFGMLITGCPAILECRYNYGGYRIPINGGLLWFALFLLAAAVLIYVYHLEQILEKRHKTNPGPWIRWSVYVLRALAAFMVSLLIYASQGPELLLHPRVVLLAGWIYLGGWVSLTMLGYASKIIPFLWWTHKYGKQAGRPGTPLMASMLDQRHVNWGLTTMVASSLLLVSGVLINLAEVMMVGGTLLSLFSMVYIILIARVFKH